jgi:hypothetical protein
MAADSIPAVRVKAQFQRSVRLDVDFDRPDALSGYILQPSARGALDTIARHLATTQQRAFTLTGPYGGGKSSLVLAVSVLAGGESAGRRIAKEVLHIEPDSDASHVFAGRKRWLVLPVVGRRESVLTAIGDAIDRIAPIRGRRPMRDGVRDIIAELVRRAENPEYGGVLLVLDELGKFLEAAAATGEDIFFYQELAEAASRCKGRLVVIGVLHQAFEQYAARLGREAREEWAKVQGRYVDIPVVAGSDETLDLIGRAIDTDARHANTRQVAKHIADAIHRRRPASPPNLDKALDACWPLHPITAALLGPSSRRKFGQNERSVFGFLTSAEPLGFRDFLAGRSADDPTAYYAPARYWNYLRSNLENAILASPDGHRWAISAEAVERVEARFDEPHVSLVKTVGLIELFRNGSGVAAETEVLAECVPGFSASQIETALDDLARTSVLVYRKHLQAWAIFAGSDFDIDAAVAASSATVGKAGAGQLKGIAALPPIPARRHYVETGTLRWFDREVVPASDARQLPKDKAGASRAGRFVLLLPDGEVSEQKAMRLASELSRQDDDDLAQSVTVYGVPHGRVDIIEQAGELAALEHVARNKPELEGDSVARREVDARLRQLRSDLASTLSEAFTTARWYFDGERHESDTAHGLSPLASEVCEKVFPSVPYIHSELVNRDVLSSSAAKAQRFLLHRMLAFTTLPNLGYEGFPADAGLYYTVIDALGLHQRQGDKTTWAFVSPEKSKTAGGASLLRMWLATSELLESQEGSISLERVYELWRRKPYGVKEGVLPILALSYLMANRSRIAVYVEGVFVPELTDAGVDEWLQDPARIAWKLVRMDTEAKKLLTKLAGRLEETLKRPVAADPLDSARALVSLALSMPLWTQRTSRVSERTRSIRSLLLRASDPVKVIFSDLPELLGTREANALVTAVGEVIAELESAYPSALASMEERLLRAIDHAGDWEALHERAQVVQGISGDLKVDAFASHLRTYRGERHDIEGMVALAVSKPPQSLTDHDFDHAALQLAKWAFEFRQVEALAAVQGRQAHRQALAVVFGGGRTVSGTFDVADRDSQSVSALAERILDRYATGMVTADIFLAALVQAGSRVLELEKDRADG